MKYISDICQKRLVTKKNHLKKDYKCKNLLKKNKTFIDKILNSPSNRYLIDNEAKNIVNTILKKKRRKCCGGIILNIDKQNTIYVLVVLGRMSKKWGLPKGGLEEEETYEECALREIREETGLLYNPSDLKERIKNENRKC